MGQPITVLGKLGDSVLFSGLSSIQTDEDQMRQVTLRAMHLVAWSPSRLPRPWWFKPRA